MMHGYPATMPGCPQETPKGGLVCDGGTSPHEMPPAEKMPKFCTSHITLAIKTVDGVKILITKIDGMVEINAVGKFNKRSSKEAIGIIAVSRSSKEWEGINTPEPTKGTLDWFRRFFGKPVRRRLA